MKFREMTRVLQRRVGEPRAGSRREGQGRGRFRFEGLEDRTLLAGNPIVDENLLPGNPASEWDIGGAGDTTLQGFATEMSVNRGQTLSFKINDTARVAYHIDIYRIGYYGGLEARRVATISSAATMRQAQPAGCLRDNVTGLLDCGNWEVSASWVVPASATSGVYLAKLIRDDTGGASHIPFVVEGRRWEVGSALPDLRLHLAGLQQLWREQPLRRVVFVRRSGRQGELQPTLEYAGRIRRSGRD